MGHAFASFATYRILSEKLHFPCFSQVPTGSDYPTFRPILPKISLLLFYISFFINKFKIFYAQNSKNSIDKIFTFIVILRRSFPLRKELRGVAQFGRAPGLGPGGRKFESCHLDFLLEKRGFQSLFFFTYHLYI